MADAPRARRLAERIQQIVARMLDTRIKDPRLGFVTVTDVRVTGDLQNATVFYTVLGSDEERAASAAALASAKGLIRSEVGKQTGIRLTPTLEFVPDAVPETAASLEEALREAAARDAQLAEMAASAAYAGEADPYRRPGEEEDLDDEESGDLDAGELEDALGDAVESPAVESPAVESPDVERADQAAERPGDETSAGR